MSLQYTDEQMLVLEKPTVTCKDVEALFGEYVEGALPPTLTARVDDHVGQCAECQTFRADYLRTMQLARELADRPVSNDIRERLRLELNRRLGIQLSATSLR